MVSSFARIPKILNDCFSPEEKILVGVSGGSDSVALLHLMAEHLPRARERIFVVHVNHGLRIPEADGDEALTQHYCEQLGMVCLHYRRPVAELARRQRLSLEEAGRLARHECFLDAARTLGAQAVALAHHLDDQAETVLMHLIRGAGSQGLSALRRVRPFPHPQARAGLRLVRPLLGVTKQELENYLRRRGLAWRTDHTNDDVVFTRNRIRKKILPLLEQEFNPQIKVQLARSAESLARDDGYLNELTDRALRAADLERGPGQWRLSLGKLRTLPASLCWRLLSRVWDELKIPNKSSAHLEHLMDLVAGQAPAFSLPGRWQAGVSREALIFSCPAFQLAAAQPYSLALEGTPCTNPGIPYGVQCKVFPKSGKLKLPRRRRPTLAHMDADQAGQALVMRNSRSRDFIRPLGMMGQRKALGKIFSEMKLTTVQKRTWPVIARGSEVLWIYQGPVSETVKIRPDTRKILQVRIFKTE
jgi:tRNA(Ile)-lysidine synthase